MHAGTRIAIAVALCGATLGCGKQDDGYSIKGAVKDAWDQPLAGVVVATPDGKQATSAADGTFTLTYGKTRPATITFSKPGWAVRERPVSAGTQPAHLTIGAERLVPAPDRDGVFVIGAQALVAVEKQPIEKLPVAPGPDGALGPELYKIATAGFVKVPAGKLRVVARGGPAKLHQRSIHERAPESYLVSASGTPYVARPMTITGGGDLLYHESIGNLSPGRYLLVASQANPDGTVPEPTEGYLIVVE